jgi:hypothetical protein
MKYIKVAATTQSEWDNCNVALIKLNSDLIELFKNKINKINELENEGIDALLIYSNYAKFLNFDNDISSNYLKLVELNDNDLLNYTPTEQDVRYTEMKIYKGGITFKGYGKHTNELFECTVSSEFITQL